MKAREVSAWRSSGLTADQFALGKPFTGNCLRQWAHHLRKASGVAAESSRSTIVRSLVPVEIRAAEVSVRPRPILVEVGSARLSILPGFD